MNARIMLVIAAIAMFGTEAVVAQDEFVPNVGEHVYFTLNDCDAAEYIGNGTTTIPPKAFGKNKALVIQAVATITKVHGDGQFDVEYTSAVSSKDGVTRMVTMTATADRYDEKTPITVRQSPAGTLVYTSPADRNPTATRTKTTTVEIDLSKAKIALRTWVLAEEMKFNQ